MATDKKNIPSTATDQAVMLAGYRAAVLKTNRCDNPYRLSALSVPWWLGYDLALTDLGNSEPTTTGANQS